MLLTISTLDDCPVEARDGSIGTVSDFLFDEGTWQIRWLVVDAGAWLVGRKLLLQPSAIDAADARHRKIRVDVTRAKVEGSPGIAIDDPIGRTAEARLCAYYGWNPDRGRGLFGAEIIAPPVSSSASIVRPAKTLSTPPMPDAGGHDVRSLKALARYDVHASDGKIGHLEDIEIDEAAWDIRYLVVDTGNRWPGKHVLISPCTVQAIDWANHEIRLNVVRDQGRHSPPLTPSARADYQFDQLHDNYDWLRYGP